ncbi:MAG: hydroxyacid dehydrogenase [Bdellovibrionales bacterium]|nr:hydroxyacid dehydrogenase [Bdellovibrionales bacterium]
MNKKILVCDNYTQESTSHIVASLDCEVNRSSSRIPMVAEVENCHALLIRSRTIINRSLLERAPQLELIITATSGFDHIDLKACTEKNITVMYTPEANKEAAAQMTIMHMLNWSRHAFMAHKAVVSHMWKEELPIGSEISEKHIGILGFGRVGKRVAELCKTFGATVSAHDPYVSIDEFKKYDVQPLGFSELLRDSDILTLHTPLTSKTKGIMNKKTFDIMNENALLINVARGQLIIEQDLFEALQSKKLAGAALDVFEKEPLPRDSQLRTLDNILLSPHIGAYTREAITKASMQAAQKTIAYFKYNEITDPLPPQADWVE